MENHLFDPFFENCWTSSPRTRSVFREVPVTPSPRRYTRPTPVNNNGVGRTRSAAAAPKVVPIPVHFVGQGNNRRFNAALKIQKVFRGFLVRKSMEKIVVIKREVDEIERKLSEKDVIELIYRNTKERLKMNEMLMRLLLRLDSIRGVDSGVRDARKSVIRKAIMLQDRVDKIAAGDLMHHEEDAAGDRISEDIKEGAGCEDPDDACEDMDICESVVDRFVEQVHNPVETSEANSGTESPEKSNMDGGFRLSVDEENSVVDSIGEGWEEIPGSEEIKETVIEIQQPEMIQEQQMMAKEDDTRDMMARMLEENQKLTELVKLQTQMISSLTQRVEGLEKAYQKDKSRRRKKKMDKSGFTNKM